MKIRLTDTLLIAGAVGLTAAIISPIVAQARSVSSPNLAMAHTSALAVEMYAADYQATETNACRVEDALFQAQDYGCKDMKTGLVWSEGTADYAALGIYAGGVDWKWWNTTVGNSTFGGYRWRQPTKAELLQLAANDDPAPDDPNQTLTHIWTAIWEDTWASDGSNVKGGHWSVNLGTGVATARSQWWYLQGMAVRR